MYMCIEAGKLVYLGQLTVDVHAFAVHIGVCSVPFVITETCLLLLQEAVTDLH